MGSEESGDKVFQQRLCGGSSLNSRMVDTNSISESMFYGSNWDPIMSMSQTGNSNMVSQSEFANPLMLEHQIMGSSSLVDLVPRIPTFGSGSFSEMITSNPPHKKGVSEEYCPNLDNGMLGASPYGKRKREATECASPAKNAEAEQQKDPSGDTSEFPKDDEKKRQIFEKNGGRDEQVSKQEPSKDNYIHVRAKGGHATNSHSLAERVRRERISERMRLLQELVPGCNKITGKALMLDEIINYVQSLQQQVEFLSMKLATVNPELNMDIDRILSKDIHGNSGSPPGLSSSFPFPGYHQGAFNNFHSSPQHIWNNEVLQMGFDPAVSMGQNVGLSKVERELIE